jgi:hypothetical protein
LILVTFLSFSIAAPPSANAFYQTTTVEGAINANIGGVWLASFHVMPAFRVRVDTVEGTKAPWKVGEPGKELAPLLGENLDGVVIPELLDPSVEGTYSIFVGDVITKINTVTVANVEEYEAALQDVTEWYLVLIRRPQLQFSNARIVKIKYEATEAEEDGVSTLGSEKVEIRVLGNQLPFADAIEEKRRVRSLYPVSHKEIDALKADWFELPIPEMLPFVAGEHRVVAASDYDQSLRRDENLVDTKFAIISQLKGNPLAGQSGQNIGIYGVREISPNKISGTYVESTLASAPFPISIDFNGGFTLTRIADYSDKDVEVMRARRAASATDDPQEADEDVETAPDVPADIPADSSGE